MKRKDNPEPDKGCDKKARLETARTRVAKSFQRAKFTYDDSNDRINTSYIRSLSPDTRTYTEAYLADLRDRQGAEQAHNRKEDARFDAELSAEHARRAKDAEADAKKTERTRVLVVNFRKGELHSAPLSTMTTGAKNALMDPDASEEEKAELELSTYGWVRLPGKTVMELDGKTLTQLIATNI